MRNYSPEEQLSFLKLKCKKLSPEIYRAYALYIQNIRINLKNTVKDVIYSIMIEGIDLDSPSFNLNSQKLLQSKVNELVDKTTSLLTVEHLLDLSRQLEQEMIVKRDIAKNQLMQALDKRKSTKKSEEGSVELTMRPPIDNPESINSWLSSDFDLISNHSEKISYEKEN